VHKNDLACSGRDPEIQLPEGLLSRWLQVAGSKWLGPGKIHGKMG